MLPRKAMHAAPALACLHWQPVPLLSAVTALQPAKVRADFHPDTGDRRQELVFIGIGMRVS